MLLKLSSMYLKYLALSKTIEHISNTKSCVTLDTKWQFSGA